MIEKKVTAAFLAGALLASDILVGYYLKSGPMVGIGFGIAITALVFFFVDAFFADN